MSRKTRPFSSQMLFTFLAALLTASQGAASTAPAIYSAVVNTSNNHITIAITGNNFSLSGLAPTVVFARTALALVSFTNQKLVATLPAGLSAGSYSLTVTNSVPQTGAFSVTIGALGPAGPQGPIGPAGPKGRRGRQERQGQPNLGGSKDLWAPLELRRSSRATATFLARCDREGRILRWVSFCSASSAFPAADHIASTVSTRPVPITKLPIFPVFRYHPQACCRI